MGRPDKGVNREPHPASLVKGSFSGEQTYFQAFSSITLPGLSRTWLSSGRLPYASPFLDRAPPYLSISQGRREQGYFPQFQQLHPDHCPLSQAPSTTFPPLTPSRPLTSLSNQWGPCLPILFGVFSHWFIVFLPTPSSILTTSEKLPLFQNSNLLLFTIRCSNGCSLELYSTKLVLEHNPLGSFKKKIPKSRSCPRPIKSHFSEVGVFFLSIPGDANVQPRLRTAVFFIYVTSSSWTPSYSPRLAVYSWLGPRVMVSTRLLSNY